MTFYQQHLILDVLDERDFERSYTMTMFYQCTDYRDILKNWIDNKKSTFEGLTYQRVAEASRIQKAYFTRVLQKKAELSEDQLYLVCEFLAFSAEQMEFAFALHRYGRCSIERRKKELKKNVVLLRDKALSVQEHTDTKPIDEISDGLYSTYFLDPDTQLVHVFLTIKQYRNDVKLIEKKLRIPTARFEKILATLEQLHLIRFRNAKIELIKDALFLPATHALFRPHRTMIRTKSLTKMSELREGAGQFVSVVFSADAKTEQFLKTRFLDMIKEAEARVQSTEAQEVYQMNFDLFSWSED